MSATDASKADECPELVKTGGGAEWWRYTDGSVWRLTMGGGEMYFRSMGAAMDSARRWGANNGYRVDIRDHTPRTLDIRFVLVNDAPPVAFKPRVPRGPRASTRVTFDPTVGELVPVDDFKSVIAKSHDGEAHVVRGADYGVSIEKLRNRITTYGGYHGLKYRTRKIGPDTLEFRLIGVAETKWSK